MLQYKKARLIQHREVNVKSGALAYLAIERDAAAQVLNDCLGDAEAKTRTTFFTATA